MTRVLALVVATLAPVGAARADAAPPDDYVDPCASMKFADSCRRCSAPEFKSRSCHEGARAAGLAERCHGWNYAMYCEDKAAAKPPQPRDPPVRPEPGDAPVPPLDVRSPPSAPAPVQQPAAAPAPTPTPAPVQQPAAAPAPTPAVVAGNGCAIHGEGDAAGLALVLVFAVRRRRRAA